MNTFIFSHIKQFRNIGNNNSDFRQTAEQTEVATFNISCILNTSLTD